MMPATLAGYFAALSRKVNKANTNESMDIETAAAAAVLAGKAGNRVTFTDHVVKH